MISDKYKCIFVYIPRTVGTSIELAVTGVDWWNVVYFLVIINDDFNKLLEKN